jgi:deoxyribose-phosphate aldolase
VTTEGTVFTGTSTGAGGAGATNATVNSLVESVPGQLRNGYTGCCGEINAASNALNAGANVEGGVMATVRIASGKLMQASPACQYVMKQLGIKVVSP